MPFGDVVRLILILQCSNEHRGCRLKLELERTAAFNSVESTLLGPAKRLPQLTSDKSN